jgi:membrane fusion protein (multidrug efflux system)
MTTASASLRLATAFLVAATLAACDRGDSAAKAAQAPPGPPAVAARVRQAAPENVPIVLDAVGQLQGSKEVEIRARVSGILLKQLYKEGQLVKEGAPLFQIDPAPYEIALAQAQAQLAQERARQEQTAREANRLKDLVQERAISQKEFDDAVSAQKLSAASLQAAEANVRQADLNLSYTRVTAPVSGVTGRLARSEGSLVTAGQDSSLLTTLIQVEPAWVRFSLSDSDLAKVAGGKLSPGAGQDIRLILPDESVYPLKGRLNFAATQIDSRMATQELRAEFDNPKVRLLPGQFVRVRITAGEYRNAFLVPQTAVFQNEKGHFLFLLDSENKAVIRQVQTGEWSGQNWVVLAGLSPGDRVVVDNLLKLRPGVLVNPQPDDAAQAANTPAQAPQGAAAKSK